MKQWNRVKKSETEWNNNSKTKKKHITSNNSIATKTSKKNKVSLKSPTKTSIFSHLLVHEDDPLIACDFFGWRNARGLFGQAFGGQEKASVDGLTNGMGYGLTFDLFLLKVNGKSRLDVFSLKQSVWNLSWFDFLIHWNNLFGVLKMTVSSASVHKNSLVWAAFFVMKLSADRPSIIPCYIEQRWTKSLVASRGQDMQESEPVKPLRHFTIPEVFEP